MEVIDEFIIEYIYYNGPIKNSKIIKVYKFNNEKYYYLNSDNEYIEINKEEFL